MVTGPPEDKEILARCGMAVACALTGGIGDADYDAAATDLYRLPEDLPVRGRLAGGLVIAVMRTDPASVPQRLRHLDGLLAIADRNPPPLPEWPRIRSRAMILAFAGAGFQGKKPDVRAALAELEELAAAAEDDPAMQDFSALARMLLTCLCAVEDGDMSVVLRMPADIRQKARDLAVAHPALAQYEDILGMAVDVMVANERGNHEVVGQALERLHESTKVLPAGDVVHDVMAETMARSEPLLGILTGTGADGPVSAPMDDQMAALSALADRPGATDAERAIDHITAGAAALAGGNETDLGRLDAGLEHFRTAVALAAPDDPQRAIYLQGLALGLLRRSEVSGTVAELEEALALLEQARDLLGGPHHPQWFLINGMLSDVRRRRGQSPESRRAALDGLRGYAWRVLLQGDTAARTVAIGNAAREAVDMARWCLVDNEPADALRALDAGRGLMLFAATELRDVATRLDDAGQSDLARRWLEATASGEPDLLPSELRQHVVAALSQEAGLLDPPSLAEVRSALVTLDADALVYLVPGERPMPGWAVIAPVDGPPSFMALPNLAIEHDVDVERFLTALADRNAALADNQRDLEAQHARSQFLGSLDSLCDWAWRAAIGPLVERYLAGRPTPASGRVPRVVLVPVGDLARIPWQAARRGDGTYAVQLAAFSQTASARMLCDAASRAPVPLSPVGLVVGDPDTAGKAPPLVAARAEAYAVHQAFYRGARYVGRRPDGSPSRSGAGTASDVRDWLTATSPAAGAMLHLACHGGFDAGPDAPRSYLLLAGDDRLPAGRDELSAEDLVGVMAKTPQHGIGLVVLAACHTGRSIHGYDEAYSLGTAFLAGGARSVLSTQWSIPDVATSSLMYMFHHYLRHDGLPAWQALREAQLWMLDPKRQPPQGMPAALHPQSSDTDHAHVVAWAGFVHWGQ
jgi:CHAT domain